MRNLALLQHKFKKLLSDKSIKHVVFDTNNSEVTYAITTEKILKLNLNQLTVDVIGELNGSDIVSIEHLSLNDELCFATRSGEIKVQPVGNYRAESKEAESVAYVDGGTIVQMAWSPDQEIVVLVTDTKSLIVMDSTFSTIMENNLADNEFGDQAFINVGWGAKETQFHGSEGKAAAKQKNEIPTNVDIDELDKTVSVCWRGDSDYFVVSFVSKDIGREFKVFDKTGRLQFTSEKTVGLEAPINWRPSGSWIAVPQVLPNKYIIALFEKNGLKHREIPLPFQANSVRAQQSFYKMSSKI